METVKEKLDRLRALSEDQMDQSGEISEKLDNLTDLPVRITRLNETGSSLVKTIENAKDDLLGGLFVAGILGLAAMGAREERAQQLELIQAQRQRQIIVMMQSINDKLDVIMHSIENRKTEENIETFLKNKDKTKKLVECYVRETLIPNLIEEKINACRNSIKTSGKRENIRILEQLRLEIGRSIKENNGKKIIFDITEEKLKRNEAEEIKYLAKLMASDIIKDTEVYVCEYAIKQRIEWFMKKRGKVRKLVESHVKGTDFDFDPWKEEIYKKPQKLTVNIKRSQ